MQVTCIKDFGTAVVGDLVEVPDGSSVDPVHWEPVITPPPADPPPVTPVTPATLMNPVKEGMLWHRRAA